MIKKLVLAALPSLALAIAAPAFAQSTMSAPATTAPAATAPAAPSAPATSGKTSKPAKAAKAAKTTTTKTSSKLAKSFTTESDAKTACGSDTVVWVNTGSKAYHLSTSKYYGKTKHGVYACAADATAAGYHASKK